MKRVISLAAICVAAAMLSCVQKLDPPKEPEVLKVAPEALKSEGWRAHEVTIKVVCDLEASIKLKDTPWASISKTELTGNGQTTVTLLLESNEGDEPRTGTLVASAGTKEATATFTQLPLGSALGVFNYDGKGGQISFDELLHQTSVRRYKNGIKDSRLLSPSEEKFLIFKNIPANLNVGGTIAISILQNWTKDMPYQQEMNVEVIKVGDGKLWLASGDAMFVIKF